MPIRQSLIKRLGKPFVVAPAYYTLAQIYRLIEQSDLGALYQIFVVVPEADGGYGCALLTTLEDQITRSANSDAERETLFHTQPLHTCTLPTASKRLVDTPESAQHIRQWLSQHVGEAMVVIDGDQVVAVFSSMHLSAAWAARNVRARIEQAVRAVRPSHDVRFTAFYPRQAAIGERYGVFVYAHIVAALADVLNDVEQFEQWLSVERGTSNTDTTLSIKQDARITVWLESDTIGFSPLQQTNRWQGAWQRFSFAFVMPEDVAVLNVRALIAIEGIECASILFTITAQPSPNPLRQAELADLNGSAQATAYKKIFISYSRRDSAVIDAFCAFQRMTGDDILRDIYSLRPGEDWQAGLAHLINEADIFMLFWSKDAAESCNVRHEWQYALQYRCPETACRQFIRPVCWMMPFVAPPPELDHLNFRYFEIGSVMPSTAVSTLPQQAYATLIASPPAIGEKPVMVTVLQTCYAVLDAHIDRMLSPAKHDIGLTAYLLYKQILAAPHDWFQQAVDFLDCLNEQVSPGADSTLMSGSLTHCQQLLSGAPLPVQTAFQDLVQTLVEH